MALRKSNLPCEILKKKIPSVSQPMAPHSLQLPLTCWERGQQTCSPALSGHNTWQNLTPQSSSRVTFPFPSYSPRTTLAPFLIPFPSLHTLMLLANPQWTCGDLLCFTCNRQNSRGFSLENVFQAAKGCSKPQSCQYGPEFINTRLAHSGTHACPSPLRGGRMD